MNSGIFRFKQFEVSHRSSGMKVGTDGVLLGAYAVHPGPATVLDIGTGSGLIALMLAQRYPRAGITAVEVDPSAAAEAWLNFSNSKWHGRIRLFETDFFSFVHPGKFDLLVCNPPFYKKDMHSPDRQRALARSGHEGTDFLAAGLRFMHEGSLFYLIFPAGRFGEYHKKALQAGMHIRDILRIRPVPGKPVHRIIAGFGLHPSTTVEENEMVIETGGRHRYSGAYINLTRDFYLKF